MLAERDHGEPGLRAGRRSASVGGPGGRSVPGAPARRSPSPARGTRRPARTAPASSSRGPRRPSTSRSPIRHSSRRFTRRSAFSRASSVRNGRQAAATSACIASAGASLHHARIEQPGNGLRGPDQRVGQELARRGQGRQDRDGLRMARPAACRSRAGRATAAARRSKLLRAMSGSAETPRWWSSRGSSGASWSRASGVSASRRRFAKPPAGSRKPSRLERGQARGRRHGRVEEVDGRRERRRARTLHQHATPPRPRRPAGPRGGARPAARQRRRRAPSTS